MVGFCGFQEVGTLGTNGPGQFAKPPAGVFQFLPHVGTKLHPLRNDHPRRLIDEADHCTQIPKEPQIAQDLFRAADAQTRHRFYRVPDPFLEWSAPFLVGGIL